MGGYNCGTKTNIAPPVCHPVQEKVVHTYETTIVPHIFPSHTKMIHHHMYQLQNHYPHTVSNEVEQCCVQQNCGC
ncbi:MAG: spore coat protein [Bacillales bacterium]|nr:spore coat protein [Bacillales bacterium]